MKIIYSDKAQINLDNIFDYISCNLGSPKSAENIVNQIQERIDDLEYFPKRYKIWCDTDMRYFTVGNYTVIYFIDETVDTIFVKNIVYSHRNIDELI